jgi:hypothetical protein
MDQHKAQMKFGNYLPRRWVLVTAVAILLGTGYWLFLQQWVDPQPQGQLRLSLPASDQWLNGTTSNQLALSLPFTTPSDLRLTLSLPPNDTLSPATQYGFTITPNQPASPPLTLWLTPSGYAGLVWGDEWLIPLAPWPHVRQGNQPNELWLQVDEQGQTSIRLNRELFWQGELPHLDGTINLAATNPNPDTPTHLYLHRLEIYQP